LIQDREDLSSVKIVDFGLSAKYNPASYQNMTRHVGTPIYMAPEVAFSQEYTKSVDIWSIGIIMYVVLTGGKHPLFIDDEDTIETYKKKLQDLGPKGKFEVPEGSFSWLARNLFFRLTKI
jgi:serine/threonine protein kinase